MGRHECNRFHRHHHQQQNLNHVHQKNTIFLPMLCSRPAIKDVHGLPRCVDRSSSSSSEPLSPRISCIGQVKRKNNRIVGFPNPHRSLPNNNNNNNNNNIVKYSKLKKFFSSKNLTPTPVAGAGDCRRRRSASSAAAKGGGNGCSSLSSRGVCDGGKCGVSLVDLDPPLPVVKRPIKTQDEVVVESLWKRRSGGVALRNLQIHHHHQHLHHHDLDQLTTV